MILQLPFCKINDEKQIVKGPVLRPEVRDRQLSIVSASVIEDAAHDFLARLNLDENGTGPGLMHQDFERDLVIVESWVTDFELEYEIEAAFVDSLKAVGVEIREREVDGEAKQLAALPVGAWMLAVKVNDPDVWKGVKLRKYRGFSIGGRAHVIYEATASGN